MSERKQLPQRRHCETVTLTCWTQPWAVTIGYYEDHKTVGEVFISSHRKTSTPLDATARDTAVLMSLALQYGVPLSVIKGAITREGNGEASSIAGVVVDFIDTMTGAMT
jgi:hypothetical protein